MSGCPGVCGAAESEYVICEECMWRMRGMWGMLSHKTKTVLHMKLSGVYPAVTESEIAAACTTTRVQQIFPTTREILIITTGNMPQM